MFTIANPLPNKTAFSSRSNLLSQNPLARYATDLLDETLGCMIVSHRFSLQVCKPNKSSPSIAAPQTKQ